MRKARRVLVEERGDTLTIIETPGGEHALVRWCDWERIGKKRGTVWLCVRFCPKARPLEVIQIVGIFTSRKKAKAACSQRNDCIGPIELNVKALEGPTPWDGAYYPLANLGRTEA